MGYLPPGRRHDRRQITRMLHPPIAVWILNILPPQLVSRRWIRTYFVLISKSFAELKDAIQFIAKANILNWWLAWDARLLYDYIDSRGRLGLRGEWHLRSIDDEGCAVRASERCKNSLYMTLSLADTDQRSLLAPGVLIIITTHQGSVNA